VDSFCLLLTQLSQVLETIDTRLMPIAPPKV
jgi:hypothetical protein